MEAFTTSYYNAIEALRDNCVLLNDHNLHSLMAVSEVTGVPVDLILEKTRAYPTLYAKQLLMYALHMVIGKPVTMIYREMNMNYNEVDNSIKAIRSRIDRDAYIKVDTKSLTQKLKDYA